MTDGLRKFFGETREQMGLDTPTPAKFSAEILSSSQLIVELLEHLNKNFPGEGKSLVADIKPVWANAGYNPLGKLAEMGNPNADKIINPKPHILKEIEKIAKKIEKFRKRMGTQPNAKKIVGAWDNFLIDHNLSDLELNKIPEILQQFAVKLATIE